MRSPRSGGEGPNPLRAAAPDRGPEAPDPGAPLGPGQRSGAEEPSQTPVTAGANGPSPTPSYGRGVRAAAAGSLLVGALMMVGALDLEAPGALRSVLLGAGLLATSASASVLVAAQLFRTAPAATAPALAALYLVKVLVLGWFLVAVGAPPWLVAGPFVVSAVTAQVLALVVFAVLAHRVSRDEAVRGELVTGKQRTTSPDGPQQSQQPGVR